MTFDLPSFDGRRKEKRYPSVKGPKVCPMRLTRGRYVTQRRQADLSRFGGRAARAPLTYEAFVPERIHDIRLELSGATASDIADAEAALNRLRIGGRAVPGLESLTHSLLRSEAVASSWIEALRVSHRKLAEAGAHAPGARYDDARAVLGNVQATSAAVRIGAASEPFSVDDILSMHGMLLSASDVPEDRTRAGRFRDEPVFIGGTNPTNAQYVGPPADRVPELVDDLVAFVNERDDLSPTVLAGLAHAQFESIHPFHDGNGRVGRCLIHTLLRRAAANDVLPPVSIAFARDRDRYVEGLTRFRCDDVDGWLSVFATSVSFAAMATVGLADRAARQREQWHEALRERRKAAGRRAPRSDSAIVAALGSLADMPAFRTRDLADRLGVTWRAALDAVTELEAVGIIRQVSAGKGNRLYEAAEVFALLDHFEDEPASFVDA
jgi:Fic family protein